MGSFEEAVLAGLVRIRVDVLMALAAHGSPGGDVVVIFTAPSLVVNVTGWGCFAALAERMSSEKEFAQVGIGSILHHLFGRLGFEPAAGLPDRHQPATSLAVGTALALARLMPFAGPQAHFLEGLNFPLSAVTIHLRAVSRMMASRPLQVSQ